ncbi:MAG: hypothetical protein V1889_01715 [archaeon]
MITKRENSLKGKLISLALAGLSFLPSTKLKGEDVNPKDYLPMPQKRVIELDFDNPLATAESRAKANYSAGQAVDYVLNKSEDDSFVWRMGKTAVDLYAGYASSYVFHEAGHEGDGLKFEGGFRNTGVPKVAPTGKSLGSVRDRLQYFADGINQNSFNSNLIWENGQRFGKFDDAGFLFNSPYGAFYVPGDVRSNGNTTNDLEGYCEALREKGIGETPESLKGKSLVVNALTFQNYASVWNLINYAVRGKTNNEPMTFSVGNAEITPPIFSHYLTDKGSYFQGDVFVNPRGEMPLKISAGSQDDKFRAGVKLYDLDLTDKLSFNPYVYTDSSGGHSIGSDVSYELSDSLRLTARVEHNDEDILESGVKGEGNGVNVTAGVEIRF